jgi:hypothetical protein
MIGQTPNFDKDAANTSMASFECEEKRRVEPGSRKRSLINLNS